MQKIWQNLVNGIKTFCEHNNFNDVALGLSGGLDSAIVAAAAAEALGGNHVYALMMRTKHTSDLSLKIARDIAKLNKLNYKEVDIQTVIDAQASFLQTVFNENPKNIVLENLQARERGKILMAFSNQFGYLVLACGNKSEAATGYCTLYGDTCVGIAPIGNVYKSDLFELAKWRNTQGLALPDEVISRAPSAELSPGQKDEDTLPPYQVLDAILKLYEREHLNEKEIAAAGFDEETVRWVISRYRATAFKREQMPKAL